MVYKNMAVYKVNQCWNSWFGFALGINQCILIIPNNWKYFL